LVLTLLACTVVSSDVVRRTHGRRVESPFSRAARARRGPPAHAQLLLYQYTDRGPDERRLVAAPALLYARRRWMGRCLCAFLLIKPPLGVG
jgi:hypothetical protein